MPSHHILTVGISLLANFAPERNLPADGAARPRKATAALAQTSPAGSTRSRHPLD